MTIRCWSSTDTPICKVEWTLLLTVAMSIGLPWVSTIKHPQEGNGCDKKDSVKQLMSLSIIASVPIYRANKSKSLQMKHTGLVTHVCSQVTGQRNTAVSKMTLQDNLSKTQLWYCFLDVWNDCTKLDLWASNKLKKKKEKQWGEKVRADHQLGNDLHLHKLSSALQPAAEGWR